MAVRMRVVWLLIVTMVVAGATAPAAHAMWSPVSATGVPPTAGPSEGAADPGKGGADPDEPLGPERVASCTIVPAKGPASLDASGTAWMHVIRMLVRISLVGRVVG